MGVIKTVLITFESILYFFYLFLNYSYTVNTYFKYDLENNIIINEIEKNLNGKLIYSIAIRKECKSDEEELILGQFDAIKESCNCYGNISYNSCSKINREDCISINPIPSKEYKIINSKYICVKKSYKSYLDLLKHKDIISKSEKCPINYKSCGIIDTFDRKLCVKNDESCPLKKIDIENTFLNLQNEFFLNKYNNINFFLNSGINNESEKIFSIFRLDQNTPCINISQKNWIYYGDLKPFSMKCTSKIKDKLYDFEYEKISNFNISLYQLYKENYVLESLPNYYEYEYLLKNKMVYLYIKNFIGIDHQKAIQFSKEKLLSSQKLLNNCIDASRIVSFILLIPIFCSLCIIGAGFYISRDCDYSAFYLYCTIFIYSIPASIVYFILNIIIFVINNKIEAILRIGSDEYINEYIEDIINESSIIFPLPLICIIIFPIVVIFGLFTFAYSQMN